MNYGLQYNGGKQGIYYQADQLQTAYYNATANANAALQAQPQPTYSQAEAIQQPAPKTFKSSRVSGYILFASKKRNEYKQKHPNATFIEITRMMSQKWKEMPESEKIPWRQESIRLNKDYREKNQHNKKPAGVKYTKGSKPLTSGFLVFASYNRKAMHASNPGMGFGEVSRIMGERWRQMNAEEKQKWAETRPANSDGKIDMVLNGAPLMALHGSVPRVHTKKSTTPGKKPMTSGYLVFASHNRKRITLTNPRMTFGEISKSLGEQWRQLTAEEKQKWAETPLPDAQNTVITL